MPVSYMPGPEGQQPMYAPSRAKRRVWPWIVLGIVLLACAGGGLALAALTAGTEAAKLPHATSVPQKALSPGQMRSGDYVVGRDLKPGVYSLTSEANCYWARVKAFDGDISSVLANGNVQPGQKAKITVKATDYGLDLQGDCLLSK